MRSLARGHTALCIKVLAGIAQNGASESARVAAAGILLDRGWGKAPTTHTGPDGSGDIKVTIRHIVRGRDMPAPREIEARPLVRLANGEDDEP